MSLRILGKRKTFKMLPPVLKHNCFNLNAFAQKLQFGYSFIQNDIKESTFAFSQYSLNSASVCGELQYAILEKISLIRFRIVMRNECWRFIFSCRFGCFLYFNAFELSLFANNIFNTEYTETNLVPMPKGNLLFGCNITLDRQSNLNRLLTTLYFRYMKCFPKSIQPELNQQEQNDALQSLCPMI
jgi:hypothetical protein